MFQHYASGQGTNGKKRGTNFQAPHSRHRDPDPRLDQVFSQDDVRLVPDLMAVDIF